MSLIEPMTLDQIQAEAHGLFANGIDVPASSDDDYKLRTTLINILIGSWENRPGIAWKELYDIDTSKTFVIGTAQYDCPASFRELGGKLNLVLGSQTLPVSMYSQERLDDDDLDQTYGYISGTPGNYKLSLVGVPDTWAGATIRYRYYRYATRLTDPTDVADMRDPHYLSYALAARLHQLGRNSTGYTVNFEDAEASMDAMVVANGIKARGETDKPLGHRINNVGAFGV